MSTPIQTVIVVYLLCFVISGGCFEKEMNSCTDTDLIVAVSYWFFFLGLGVTVCYTQQHVDRMLL